MYTTTVTKRKLFGEKKSDLLAFLPLGIWLVVFLVFFIMFCKEIYWAGIVCVVDFFSIIPIVIIINKNMKKFKGENSLYEADVTFEVKDGELYAEGEKILHIQYDQSDKILYMDNIMTRSVRTRTGRVSADYAKFMGFVKEPYLADFEAFLLENDIGVR